MNAIEVRKEVLSWMDNAPPLTGCAVPGSGDRGVVTGLLNSVLKLDDDLKIGNERRRQVLAWLFRDLLGKPNATGVSAKDLTDGMWWALCKYVDAHKDQDSGVWKGREGLSDDMCVCWRAMEAWQREFEQQLGFPDL